MQHYTIVSDLHFGQGDFREDFLDWDDSTGTPAGETDRTARIAKLDSMFGRLLKTQLAAARASRSEPHLILLGDFIDLWQVRRRGEAPAVPLSRALSAHAAAVSAIRNWIGAGGAVSLVLGNHDHALCDPRAWALLREVLPTLNDRLGGAPAWSLKDEEAGLWAVHGHRWDAWNRIRRRTPDDSCVGRLVSRNLVNPLKESFPLVDKGDLAEFLLVVREAHGHGSLPCPPQELLELFIRVERSGMRFCDCLAAALSITVPLDPHRVRSAQRERFRGSMNRELERLRTRKPAELPAQLRFIAFGHTHEFSREESGGVSILNTGTWRPLAQRANDGRLAIHQPLHYTTIAHDGEKWRATMAAWRGSE